MNYLPVKGMMAVLDLSYRLSEGVIVAWETVVEQCEVRKFPVISRDMEQKCMWEEEWAWVSLK